MAAAEAENESDSMSEPDLIPIVQDSGHGVFSNPVPGQRVKGSEESLELILDGGVHWSDGAPCCYFCGARFVDDPVSLEAHFEWCFNTRIRTAPSLPMPEAPNDGVSLFDQHPFDLPAPAAHAVLTHCEAADLGRVCGINHAWRLESQRMLAYAVFKERGESLPSSMLDCSCLCCSSTVVALDSHRPHPTFVVRSDAARRRDATLQSVDIHLRRKYNSLDSTACSFRLKNVAPEGSPSVLATLTVGDLYHIICAECTPYLVHHLTGHDRALPLLLDCRTMRALVHLDAPLAMYLSSAEPIWLEWIPNIKPECFLRSARVWANMLANSGRSARWFVESSEPIVQFSLVRVEVAKTEERRKAFLSGVRRSERLEGPGRV